MSIMESMMGLMMERMSKEDKEAMMDSMMSKFFADITPEEKQKMMADMMPRMMEGMDMSKMMPRMMMGMMSGAGQKGGADGDSMMKGMMGGPGGAEMGEAMLGKMMPACIEMMLPRIDPGKRRAVATTVLKALVDKGTEGMSDEERHAYLDALAGTLKAPA